MGTRVDHLLISQCAPETGQVLLLTFRTQETVAIEPSLALSLFFVFLRRISNMIASKSCWCVVRDVPCVRVVADSVRPFV